MTFPARHTTIPAMTRASAPVLAVLCLAVALWSMAPGAASAQSGSIYYYEDSQGVLHFTNTPETTSYRVFAVFRNFPDADKDDVLRVIRTISGRHGMDHCLIQAVVQVESNYDAKAVSSKGAQGAMQIMPGTGRDLGVDSPFDLEENIDAGVRYLKQQVQRFGDVRLALAAYNAGPAQVERYGGVPPFQETQDYVRKVLTLYRKLKGG